MCFMDAVEAKGFWSHFDGSCTDRDEVEVLDFQVPREGECEGVFEGVEVEERGVGASGSKFSDEDYLSTILSSLPDALSNFTSVQMLWTLQQTQQLMDASTLMMMLLQEAEWQNLRAQKHKQVAGKSKEDEKGEALAVSMEKPKGKRDMSKINCWNCGEAGHFSSKCDKPKKTKDNSSKSSGNSDSKKEGTSAAVNSVNSSSDDEGAWAAEELSSDSDVGDWFLDEASAVDEVSCVDGEMDWFDEAVAADVVLPKILALLSDDEAAEIVLPEILTVPGVVDVFARDVDSDNEGGDLEEELVVEESNTLLSPPQSTWTPYGLQWTPLRST